MRTELTNSVSSVPFLPGQRNIFMRVDLFDVVDATRSVALHPDVIETIVDKLIARERERAIALATDRIIERAKTVKSEVLTVSPQQYKRVVHDGIVPESYQHESD